VRWKTGSGLGPGEADWVEGAGGGSGVLGGWLGVSGGGGDGGQEAVEAVESGPLGTGVKEGGRSAGKSVRWKSVSGLGLREADWVEGAGGGSGVLGGGLGVPGGGGDGG
jgi:hypothetical protein